MCKTTSALMQFIVYHFQDRISAHKLLKSPWTNWLGTANYFISLYTLNS